MKKINKSEAEWKKELTPEQYRILREKATERPGSGEYTHLHDKGEYCCAACGLPLFDSTTKFESGSGWPSFYAPVQTDHVDAQPDDSLGTHRTEILCARCQSHLGHVFDDGPNPTGLRYCVNSVSLVFHPKNEEKK